VVGDHVAVRASHPAVHVVSGTAAQPLDSRARLIGMVLVLGGLMVIVDTTATLVTVPAIVADFDSTLPAVQWVTSGYLLGVVAAIPLSGWMANRFGARRVYVTALGVFTLASALTGLAWDVHALVAFRVLQGLAGGLLNPVGQAIGLRAVSRAARGRMMSMLGLPLIIGPVLGPPLAGWLIDTSTWRWVFLVNVPLGLLAMALCLVLLPRQKPDRSSAGEIDALGLALVSLGAVLLVYGCTARNLTAPQQGRSTRSGSRWCRWALSSWCTAAPPWERQAHLAHLQL